MKKNGRNTASTITVDEQPPRGTALAETHPRIGQNGKGQESSNAELVAILASLQTMRDGDFSVRLPGHWVGIPGKIADTFNEIVAANQQMAQELMRRPSDWQRRQDAGADAIPAVERCVERD